MMLTLAIALLGCDPEGSAEPIEAQLSIDDYTADINIIPRRRFWDPRKLLAPLDREEMEYLIAEGEAATWPQVEMIRNCSMISHTLDNLLEEIEGDVVGLYRPTATPVGTKAVA